jgi:sugar phosphate isomerase/epimerase
MKYGAQLYTVRDYTKTPEDIEATLRQIKAMGFDLIQISGFGPCDPDLLAGWVKELGLEVCVTHTPWERVTNPAELKKVIAEHKKLACSHIGLGSKPGMFADTCEGWTRFIKKVNDICKQVQDAGMTYGYHNHDFDFERFNGVCAIDRLIAECPDLYFIPDLFWIQAGGANPLTYLDKLKGRIKVVHFKDYRIVRRTRQFAEIGQGNMEWQELVPRCEKTAIPYAVIEQDADYLLDPFDSLALSRKFLIEAGYWKQA